MGSESAASEDYRAERSTSTAGNAPSTHLPGIPAEVDEAAEQVFGVSASDIITVLFALANWPELTYTTPSRA